MNETIDAGSTLKLYSARWVLPMSSGAIESGAVVVGGSRIVAVGGRTELAARFPEAVERDFQEAVILPGLVNCHSHLELTVMRGFLEREECDFKAWLQKLTKARLERMTPDDIRVSAAWGAVEAARAGVTCVADASDGAASSVAALREVGLRATVYQELFGPDARLAREQLEKLREKISSLREQETALVRVGVSPHAPYTVSGALLELATDYALGEDLPMMMHAAESRDESLFVGEGRGAFAENLARRGIEWHAPGVSTIQYLAARGLLAARPLLAHCVTVDDADIHTIKEAGASVAHCPKSNAKLGHGHAPFASFVANHLAVGLGSDSVASNNACDLLEEARFALLLARAVGRVERSGDEQGDARQLTAEDVLRVATVGGANALGLRGQTGALAEGLQADLVVVSLAGAHQQPVYDPSAALVFSSSARDVLLTLVAGREIYKDGRVTTVDEERLRARLSEIREKLASI
ncbi:MAG TPA: amidohydrolase family protein [Pyrinomonadaceae bacterium]|jgi:5-methylthioadenosine/S-adenosylhomocysteine deaminase